MKTFPDKQKLRESVTTRPALREMPRGVLQGDLRGHWTETRSRRKEKDLSEDKNTSNDKNCSYCNTGVYSGFCFLHDLRNEYILKNNYSSKS